MKEIKDRASEFIGGLSASIGTTMQKIETICKYFIELGFVAGAKSEHEELTRWNSPGFPPEDDRQVLLKVKTVFIGKIYYKVGSFINGDYCESSSGRSLKAECLGWRDIHE